MRKNARYSAFLAQELVKDGKTVAQIADMFGVERMKVLRDTNKRGYEKVTGSMLDGSFVIPELVPVRESMKQLLADGRKVTLNANEIERVQMRYAAGLARKSKFVSISDIALYVGIYPGLAFKLMPRSVIHPLVEKLLAEPETKIGEDAA